MNPATDTYAILAYFKTMFNTSTDEATLAAVYNWWFVPRSTEAKVTAVKHLKTLPHTYKHEDVLPDWMYAAYAYWFETDTTEDSLGAKIATAIDRVLDTHPVLVSCLGNPSQDWVRTLPLIDELVFMEVYGELPQNPPGTPKHYAYGAADPRFKVILHGKVTEDLTGMRYLRNVLAARGKVI